MSDDSNVSIDGEINAGWTSYYNPSMSKTVDVHDSEGDGEVEHTHIPKEANLDDLTESEREVIVAASANVKQSTGQIADALGYSAPHVRNTLKEHTPNWYENIFKEAGKSTQKNGRSDGNYDYAEFYEIVEEYNGISAAELATEVQASQKTARKALREGVEDGILRKETNVDGYHGRTVVYYPAESGTDSSADDSVTDECGVTDDTSLSVTEAETVEMESEDEPTAHGKGTFTEGDKEALNELFGDSVATAELQAVIDAMKATATNEETVNALEVVEEYL